MVQRVYPLLSHNWLICVIKPVAMSLVCLFFVAGKRLSSAFISSIVLGRFRFSGLLVSSGLFVSGRPAEQIGEVRGVIGQKTARISFGFLSVKFLSMSTKSWASIFYFQVYFSRTF